MKGKYSNNKFFQGSDSESSNPKYYESLFEKTENKFNQNINSKLPISMILYDELGLNSLSSINPFKTLHSKLEIITKKEWALLILVITL